MITLYLMRHGTRVNRMEDTQLNENGIKQAKQTAIYLKNKDIHCIYASPLPRTQETAQIIANELQLPVIADDRLTERMIFDETKKETFEEFLAEWDKTMADRDYQPVYGDSPIVAGDRVISLVDELSKLENKNILIVSHGGIIGDFLRNIFPETMLSFRSIPNTPMKYIEITECSLTQVQKKNGTYILNAVNDTKHLEV